MTDYLLIECIINELVRDGIIDQPQELWKKTAIGTQFYFADFYRSGSKKIISFRVSIIAERHVISATAFINQAMFLNYNPANALDICKLTE